MAAVDGSAEDDEVVAFVKSDGLVGEDWGVGGQGAQCCLILGYLPVAYGGVGAGDVVVVAVAPGEVAYLVKEGAESGDAFAEKQEP